MAGDLTSGARNPAPLQLTGLIHRLRISTRSGAVRGLSKGSLGSHAHRMVPIAAAATAACVEDGRWGRPPTDSVPRSTKWALSSYDDRPAGAVHLVDPHVQVWDASLRSREG